MKVIKDTMKLEIEVKKEDLISGQYIPVSVVSDRLRVMEEEKEMPNKSLRYRFYNTVNSNRYNTKTFAGIKCIDIKEPMIKLASLELTFKEI